MDLIIYKNKNSKENEGCYIKIQNFVQHQLLITYLI